MCHDTIPYYLFGSNEKCYQFHLDNVTLLSNNTMFLFSKKRPDMLLHFLACLKLK